MDNDETFRGETSTIRTHDRGEVSGKPAGTARDGDATSEEPIHEQELAHGDNPLAHDQRSRRSEELDG